VQFHAPCLNKSLQHAISSRTTQGLLRRRRQLNSPQGPVIRLNNREILNFCSNDYLGLANHAALINAFKQGVEKYGVGSGASHMVCGHSEAHARLEECIAEFTGRKRALIFSTGYMANLAIVTSLLGRSGVLIGDRLNHASIMDAAQLSRATLRRYKHSDPRSLEDALNKTGKKNIVVVTEGVFSMDGDIAPLPELATVCRTHHVWLAVDDAHGFGVLGEKGGGALNYFDMDTQDAPILMATFGKALGSFGAFVAGDNDLIEMLIQTARPYIYTTAPPPALAYATVRAIELIGEEAWRREHLLTLIQRFRAGARQLGLPIKDSMTPIQPLIIGEARRTVELSNALLDKGIFITAIRPPTIPKGTSRLRITLTAAHSEQQVDRLLETLASIL